MTAMLALRIGARRGVLVETRFLIFSAGQLAGAACEVRRPWAWQP
jgi:hypothetical protein